MSEGRDPAIWRVATVATIGSFMAQLDATVVNVSLSSLAAELASTLGVVQWVTSGYLLALALMLPLNGWLVDRIGAKRVYLAGFVAFTLTSGLCGLAWSAYSLIGFRIVQGMSAGLLAPMAQIMLARAAGARFARVAGFAAVPVLLAPMLGPAVAGAILQFASWRWLFLINLPVGALALVLAYTLLPADHGETRARGLDLIGMATLSPCLICFLFGADHLGDEIGFASFAAASVLMTLFVRSARAKGDAALIDLRLLSDKAFTTSLVSMFLMSGVGFAGQMLTPIFLIRQCGFSPSRTGWLMAPLGFGMLCTFPFMGALINNFGLRRLAASGAAIACLAVAPLAFVSLHGMSLPLFVAALFLRGVGMSVIGLPSISAAYASVARRDLPMATSAMNIVQRLGGPTMTTLVAALLAWTIGAAPTPQRLAHAFAVCFIVLGGLHALLLVAALRLPQAIVEKRATP